VGLEYGEQKKKNWGGFLGNCGDEWSITMKERESKKMDQHENRRGDRRVHLGWVWSRNNGQGVPMWFEQKR